MKTVAEDIIRGLEQEAVGFAELAGTLHALRFTGAITLHFLNGQPQMAEVGRPIVLRFPEHPANKAKNPVDRQAASAASSSP